MTAFDHFQIATCLIGEDDKISAKNHLRAAIRQIDKDGVDRHMRADLADLLRRL